MQTQSRLASSGGSSSSATEDEHEAVIRELMRRHELTAQLLAEALRALRGQGQVPATAAFILQEVSRAFTICHSIMSSSAPSQLPPTIGMPAPALAPRRSRDDNIPREQRMTSSPHFDGYQWKKYGQKRITKMQFPRWYYRCSFHRERNCQATKQVQQCSNGDPPQYVVMYFHEHTCGTTAWEPAAAAGNSISSSIVSSLTCELGGQHQFQQSPASSGTAAAVAANVGHEQERSPRTRTRDAPTLAGVDIDVDMDAGLDVMDYDVTDALCFGNSSDLPDDGFPF